MESLTHLAIIWCSVYVANLFAAKTRLTSVLYFLGIGSLMANLGVLPLETNQFIEGLAELGIILIMFALGFEESTSNFIKSIKRSWGIAFFGALAPFCAAYSIAYYFWDDTNIAIMCGLTMTATAVSLTMISLKLEGLQKNPVSTCIMTSAVLDDILSLVLVAILVPLASGDSVVGIQSIGLIIGKVILFFSIIVATGLWVFPHNLSSTLSRIPILGKYGVLHILSFEKGEHATLTVLLIALLIGLLAHYFGFHPAVGAYMAGLIIKEEYFHFHDPKKIDHYHDTKKIVDNVAFSWIGPVFFVVLGTKVVFDWEIFVSIIPQTVVLTLAIFIAQVSSAAAAARYTAGFNWKEGMMVGFGMLGRAELAFVVMDIAYNQNQILSIEAFYTLMLTAFWLNIAVPVSIKLWKPHFSKG